MNASYKTAIQFSNLYIPVKMLKVSHDSSIELNQLCKDSKERVRYRKYCPSCDKEITNEDIVKGYQYANSPDKFIILEQSDIDSITTDQDKVLKIQQFCKSREISDLLIDKSYYLIPEMDGEEQYNLLRKAMVSNRVVGIAEIVLGTKQELVSLFANKDCIIATILFYENERATTLRMALEEKPFTSISLLTGPEGGLEEREVEQAKEFGLHICTLGNRILRCETAPLCALSAVMYASGEF